MADMATAEDALKEIFVHEWLRTGDPFKAGVAAFPGDSGRALRASWEWPQDLAVLEYRAVLIEESDGAAGLPSKNELALEVYRLADKTFLPEDKLAAYELTAKILGYIQKPEVIVDNSTQIVNKVMVIKDYGPEGTWEQRLEENQKQLTHKTEH